MNTKKNLNPFAHMQKVAVETLCIVCTLFGLSCQNEAEQPLSDEQISFNLSKMGKIDPALLIGEWDAIAFAYTADGNKISDVATISSDNTVYILDDPYLGFSYNDEFLGPLHFKQCYFNYSRSSNLINFIQEKSYCWAIFEQYTDDEMKISNSLRNMYSFVIKDSELIIRFTGEKNENLLILKKR